MDHVEFPLGVAVGGVDDDEVDALLDEGHGPLEGGTEEADGGTHPQPPLGVTSGLGVLVGLDEVLEGEQALETAIGVHQGKFLDLVGGQQLESIRGGGADRCGDQWGMGHDLAHRLGHVILETHVAVGDDADEPRAVVHHGHPGDPVLVAQLLGIGHGGLR